jgi:acetyl esterase/lipase
MTVLEPAAQEFADAAAHPPFAFQLPLAQGRAAFIDLQSGDVAKPPAEVSDHVVHVDPTGDVPVRIVRPQNSPAELPVILYLHAGWAFGDVTTHDRLVRELAVGAHAAVVFPSFSLSPEARYPTAVNEIYAVAEWVRAHGASNGLDGSRIAIGGDSAGGNMGTVVAMMAKERSGPAFVHQFLFYPVLDPSFDTPSYREFATGFHVRRDHAQWLWDQYVPDMTERSAKTVAPLRATTEELAGLPPATIITAEADVVRDEAETYASRLRAAGVPVTGVRYLGTIHDFMVLNALRDTRAAQAAISQIIVTLRNAFGHAD